METKEIQKLIDFISNSGLDEVSIETSELKLSIKRYGAGVAMQAPIMMAAAPMPQPQVAHAPAAAAIPAAQTPVVEAVSNLVTIKSPMIGTFYATAKPGVPPFVEIGTEIQAGKVLCVIEAMKLFNEIESEIAGKIVKILVENNSPVEYDQPLFLVEPQ